MFRVHLPIENNTAYKGIPFITFEKFPYYYGRTKLNKVHLNLGFTKLVSRVSTKEIDLEKVRLIEQYTGGRMVYSKMKDKFSFKDTEPLLVSDLDKYNYPFYFTTNDGLYMGDIDTGWWYYKNNLVVTEKKPIGCALKLKERLSKCDKLQCFNDYIKESYIGKDKWGNIEGFVGYTHRGSFLFRLGDNLFDEQWVVSEATVGKENYLGYLKMVENKLGYELTNRNLFEISNVLKDYIPFKEWGYKKIETLEECEQAAINFSNYLN